MLIYTTKCATGEAGTVYPSGPPEFTHGFIGVCVSQSLIFCVVFCKLMFDLYILGIVLFSLFDLRLVITPLISSNFC